MFLWRDVQFTLVARRERLVELLGIKPFMTYFSLSLFLIPPTNGMEWTERYQVERARPPMGAFNTGQPNLFIFIVSSYFLRCLDARRAVDIWPPKGGIGLAASIEMDVGQREGVNL